MGQANKWSVMRFSEQLLRQLEGLSLFRRWVKSVCPMRRQVITTSLVFRCDEDHGVGLFLT